MAKRFKTRGLKKHHSYTVDEVAEAIGAHPQTIRAWRERGLTCLDGQSPHLILGEHLLAFLSANTGARKQRLRPGQLYCLRCKAPRMPAGSMADFIPDGRGGGMLSGICPDCETMCHRFVREDRLSTVAPEIAIVRQRGEARLMEPDTIA